MNRLHLVMVALVGALFLSAGAAMAQDNGGGRQRGQGGPGGNFDPAQMRQRMEERMKEQLGVNDDEWKVLQPKLQKVQEAQRNARGGMMGGMMFGRGGDRGRDNQPETPVAKAQAELRTTLENKNAPAADIAKKLTAYREAREKAKTDLTAAQKELKELLTQRQEAVLVMMGTLE